MNEHKVRDYNTLLDLFEHSLDCIQNNIKETINMHRKVVKENPNYISDNLNYEKCILTLMKNFEHKLMDAGLMIQDINKII